MEIDYQQTNWWKYMDEPMRNLVRTAHILLDREEKDVSSLDDYSFVIFPMAKAYEGFLKKLFFDLKFISVRQYHGDRFRIGKSLNPNLPKRYQWDWVYGKLVNYCQGSTLPDQMWDMWRQGRNRTFHYFSKEEDKVSLQQARSLIRAFERTMSDSLAGCRI